MSYLLTESLHDTIVLYMIMRRLTMPWKQWEAYKLGIIDETGKKIKNPVTSRERESWNYFERFMANLKKLMVKFVGRSQLASIITTAFMLKDSLAPVAGHKLNEDLTEGLDGSVQLAIKKFCNDLGSLPQIRMQDVGTQKFDFYLEKYTPIVQELIDAQGLDKVLGGIHVSEEIF